MFIKNHLARRSARRSISIVGIILLTFMLSGCILKKKPKPQDSLSFGLLATPEAGCLSDTAEFFDKYLNGRLEFSNISQYWNCASNSIQVFQERTRGATTGVYTEEELRTFLQHYFLSNRKISDGLADSVMRIKQAILGGTQGTVTVAELTKVRAIMATLRDQMIRLHPYMPLTFSSLKNESEEKVRNAMTAVVDAATAFGTAIDGAGIPYSMEELSKLLAELNALRKDQIHNQLEERLPLLESIKRILIGPSNLMVGNETKNWSSLLRIIARWYGVFTQIAYALHTNTGPFSGSSHLMFADGLNNTCSLLEEAVSRYPEQVIPFSEFDQLVNGLKAGEIPIEAKTLQNFLRPLFNKFLGGGEPGTEGLAAKGLTISAIKRIRAGIESWSQNQQILEKAYATLSQRNDMKSFFSDISSTAGTTGSGYTADKLEPLLENTFFSTWLQKQYPPLLGEYGNEIQFSHPDTYTFHDLSQVNLLRQLSILVLQGYSTDPNRRDEVAGLTFNEFHVLADDVVPLCEDLRLLDKRMSATVDVRRFREGMLFMYASNGSSLYTLDEAIQHGSFLISAATITNKIHKDIVEQCHATELDPYSQTVLVPPTCFYSTFFRNFRTYLNVMPDLIKYYEHLDSQKQRSFEQALILTAQTKSRVNDPLSLLDTQNFVGALQFLEALVARYDTDRSGTISKAEASLAIPIFFPTLRAFPLLNGLSDKQIEALFYYMLAHGEMPSQDLPGKLKFWLWSLGAMDFEADRGNIMAIFSALSELY